MNENNIKFGYTGYHIYKHARRKLIEKIAPIFDTVIIDHVTYEYGVQEQLPIPAEQVTVIATVTNDNMQVLIVEVNGTSIRPDGKIFHITYSYDKSSGVKSKDANILVQQTKWIPITPFTVPVMPKFYTLHK